MRNLKKLLALVVACVMVFGVVASAAVVNFPDVASTAKYAEAVKVLSALNIINGDDKGNFNPDKDVTRAEMAKILCAMISTGSFGQTASGFEDVTADHWASGYVKYAKGLGIINGYNDKEFGPEDNVTYEQAIKLIVAALGYTYMAEDQGGYPSGYMMVAADLKITDKVVITDASAPAKRSDIAMLAYNAMEVNMMKRTSYGTEAKYEPVNENLLNNKLGMYSFEGYVESSYNQNTNYDDGEIDFRITKASAAAVAALDLSDTDPGADGDQYALIEYFCQDKAAADLLFYTSKAYVAENEDGDWEIVAVVAKTTKTKEIVFDDLAVLCDETAAEVDTDEVMDLNADEEAAALGYGVFSYWSTADHDDRRPTTLKVDTTARMIINNATSVPADEDLLFAVDAGSLKIIDTDNDGDYDLFIVTSYYIAVVDSVSANTMTVRFKQGVGLVNTLGVRSLALNEDTADNLKALTVTIDGEAAELTDLAENDVVYIATNGVPGAGFDPTFVEIIASRKVVEGKVTTNVNVDGIVEISGEEYEVAASLRAGFPGAGAEGKFYLTQDGIIVYTDTTATISDDYAYVYKVGRSSFGDMSLRMLTAEGEDVTYDIADRIAINGVQTATKKADAEYTAAQMVQMFGGVEADYYVAPVADDPATPEDETVAGVNNLMTPEEIIDALVASADAEMKLVAYDVSGTEITKLYIATGVNNNANAFGVVNTQTKTWIAATNKFKASKTLAAGAKIFMIEPTAEFADWKVVDATTLVDDKEYDVAFYGYNEDGTYNVALISSGNMAADTEAAFAYFKEARTTTYGDEDAEEDAQKVYFIQGGEEKVMYILDSEASSAVVAGMAEGDVFVYAQGDDENLMTNVDVLAVPVADLEGALFADALTVADFDVFNAALIGNAGDEYMYTYTTAYEADNEVMAGIIAAVNSVDGGLKIKLAVDENVADSDFVYMIPETANVVVLNNKVTKNKLYASTLDSIMPSEYVALANGNIDITAANAVDTTLYYAIVRMYNDVVTDVYVINYDNDMPKYTK